MQLLARDNILIAEIKVGYFEAFISFAYKDNKLGDILKNLTREILE